MIRALILRFRVFLKIKKFLPDEIETGALAKDLGALNNSYDNNICEIDRELESLFAYLSHTTAVYIYAADHGVALGENGKFLQGNTEDPVIMPAFFIWMSPLFIEKYPGIYMKLKSNEHKTVSHDNLYHTILSLGFIHSAIQKKELDLTNPEAKEFIPPEDKTIFLQGM